MCKITIRFTRQEHFERFITLFLPIRHVLSRDKPWPNPIPVSLVSGFKPEGIPRTTSHEGPKLSNIDVQAVVYNSYVYKRLFTTPKWPHVMLAHTYKMPRQTTLTNSSRTSTCNPKLCSEAAPQALNTSTSPLGTLVALRPRHWTLFSSHSSVTSASFVG